MADEEDYGGDAMEEDFAEDEPVEDLEHMEEGGEQIELIDVRFPWFKLI
jgi:hypothetical protein